MQIPAYLSDALDIETAPTYGYPQEYALQPWRVQEGKARMTVIATGGMHSPCQATVSDFGGAVASRVGKPTTGWNVLFDIAWLIAYGYYDLVNKVPWYDAMLLWKWLENGAQKERMPKWSLVDGAKRFLKDWDQLPAFLELKASDPGAGVDDEYWELRAQMDVRATALIGQRIWEQLDDRKRRAATIEAQCLVPAARSWLIGVYMNAGKLAEAVPDIVREMHEIEQKLEVPGKVLSSPTQLGQLLFQRWGVTPIDGFVSEKTGNVSTDKKHLTYLADHDDRILSILRWRELNTRKSKFVKAPIDAFEYLGSTVVHPAPKLFSTYTGRMTYSSKTKQKFPTGVALHQWQRNKTVRALIGAPPGYRLVEFDASGQEDRLMAEESQDPTLVRLFKDEGDIHCYTAASITGRGYDEILQLKQAKNEWVTGSNGVRQAGKFTNHSNKYRIGKRKMRITARVDYGLNITMTEAGQWQNSFHRSFPGIKRYWSRAMHSARVKGYAETLAGRTFLTPERFYNKDDKWSTESSSINFPIQGGGADMKELGIATLHDEFPEFLFAFDLHDGLFYYVPIGTPTARVLEAKACLDNLNYEDAWGYKPTVPLLWDGEVGDDWGHMIDIEKYQEPFL